MMWIAFAIASLCAAAFVLWGLLRRGATASSAAEVALNRTLLEEKLAELDSQQAEGEIDAGQRRELEVEYKRQFLVDSGDIGDDQVRDRGRWIFPVMAVAVPLFAVLVYLRIGAADELVLRDLFEERFTGVTAETPAAVVRALDEEIFRRLEELGQRHPSRPVYPVLLARFSHDRGDLPGAIHHYRRAVALLPADGSLMAEYAQVLFLASNNEMTEQVRSAVLSAYTLAPNDQTALGLMGIAAFQESRYEDAIRHWQRALRQLPGNSPSRQALQAGIQSAEQRLTLALVEGTEVEGTGVEGTETRGADNDAEADPKSTGVVVEVSLAEGLDVPPDTTVFVYARAWQGAAMPLAIKRLTRADLPARVTLDNSATMNPAITLESADELEVVARVSFAGNATPASGDLEGSHGPVKATALAEPLSLVIARKIP